MKGESDDMFQRICHITLCLMLLLPLSGCWDIKFLDQLSIVLGMGLDVDPDNPDNILVSLQVVVPSQASESSPGGGGGTSGIPVTKYIGRGKTILDALQNMDNVAPRRFYFAHNQMMIIGEDLAKKGVDGLFDLIDRDPEIRIDFSLLVAKHGTAAQVLETLTNMEKLPVKQMYKTLESYNKRASAAYPVSMKEFILKLNNPGEMAVTGSVEFIGDSEKAGTKENVEKISPDGYLRIGNMAVFKNGKLTGYLNPFDSKGLAIIKNKVQRLVVPIPVEEGKVHIAVLHSKASVKARFSRGKPEVVVRIKQRASVFDVDSRKIRVDKKETISWLEKEAEQQVNKMVNSTISTLQHELDSDALGYGNLVYKASPSYWKAHKKEWETLFPEIRTVVSSDVEIYSTGVRNQSYLQNMK